MKSKVGINSDAHFFFCGPPPMTEKIIEGLVSSGIEESSIHDEKFASPVAFDPEKIPHRTAKISFLGKDYEYSGKQTLLEFLESKGEGIPFACRVGVCGTCKFKVKGKTESITKAGLTLSEKREQMILSCVAFPEGDVEVELG